jgi:hypothetical protein
MASSRTSGGLCSYPTMHLSPLIHFNVREQAPNSSRAMNLLFIAGNGKLLLRRKMGGFEERDRHMARVGHGLHKKFLSGPPCPTLLCPTGGPPVKRPYGCFKGGPPAERPACGRLLPLWAPHAIRLWWETVTLWIILCQHREKVCTVTLRFYTTQTAVSLLCF